MVICRSGFSALASPAALDGSSGFPGRVPGDAHRRDRILGISWP